jgi:hypothetical protein
MSHTRRIRNNMWILFLIIRRSRFLSCIAFLFLLYDTYTTTAHSQYVYIEIGRPDYFRQEARRSSFVVIWEENTLLYCHI